MQTKIKKILKNSAIYSTGNSATKLVGFVLIPIYTKYLSIEDFGVLGLVEVTSQILIGVFGLALYRAFIRWYWDPQILSKQKSVFFTTLLTCTVISILMVVVVWNFSSNLALILFGNTQYQYLINLMALSSSAQILSQVILSLMRVQEKPVLYSISNLVRILITFSLTIYLITTPERGIIGIYEAQMVGYAIFFIHTFKYVLLNIQPKIEFKILNDMLKFSYPLIFSSLFGILITVVDRYFLKFMVGLEDVGIYTFGSKISNVLKLLLIIPFQLAVTPIIYKMIDNPQNKRFYSKMMTYSGYIVIFFALSLSIFSKDIVHFLAHDNSYWAATSLIPILSFSLVFDMLRTVAIIGLNISKKTKIIALIIIFISIINISLNIILIPIWQYLGAAIANLGSHILFYLFIYVTSQKYYPIPYEIQKLTKLIVVGLLLYLCSGMFINLDYFIDITLRIILILSYPFILYLWNFYEEIEIDSIKKIVRKLNKKNK